MKEMCPECGKENNVAGYRSCSGRQGGEGTKKLPTLYCGFCGKAFTPAPRRPEGGEVKP